MFILNKGKPEIEPKMLFVPEFKRIWNRDKSVKKARANLELAYVYFVADYQSEYNIYGAAKLEMIAIQVMEDKTYTPDGVIEDAIAKYEKMQETSSMRYLRSVRATVDSMMEYYDDLRYKGIEDGKKFNPKQTMDSMKAIEDIIQKIEKWEKKVRGEEDDMQIRGGGKVGLFEDPQSVVWLKKPARN